jgi:DNA-binding MarR family transcriptional regulator
MKGPFNDLADLDRTVHAPPRLAILTVLLTCERADFTFLLTATGLTKGNLASNLATLETAGLIILEKETSGRRNRTTARLTGKGQQSIAEHWEQLDSIRRRVLPVPVPG